MGVLWAIDIGFSALALTLPGISVMRTLLNGKSFVGLAIALYVFLVLFFIFCILMTVLCYATRYSRCCCCPPGAPQLEPKPVQYVTGNGNAAEVVAMPTTLVQPSY